ncbi:MAG TPA: vWA domain-containing protein [Chthonomonadaceae bacterium]|nr:vWA domain-containing protein [Chthonomonadaceae bacterium]
MIPLHFEPPFLPVQTAALALIAVSAVFLLYARRELRQRVRRHPALPALRGAVVLLLALLLLNPVVSRPAPQARGKIPFLLLLDTSRSMATADVADGRPGRETRWEAARRAVLANRSLLDALSQRYAVRLYGFDARATARPLGALLPLTEPGGKSTALGSAIAQAVSANPLPRDAQAVAGLLLVSDGRDNGTEYAPDAARAARALGYRVYTACVGQERKETDLLVAAKRPQVFSAPGQTVEIGAEIRDTGISSAPVRVDLLREGRRVASRNLIVTPGRRAVAFPLSEPRKGFYRYALACSLAPNETNELNNRANVFLNVMESRARVLLLEGRPTWDAKFLAQTLREDPTVTLDCLYKLTADHYFALSGSADRPILRVPRTVEDFARYDVIILGKGYEEFFDAAATEALQRWVGDRGGNLVFLRGRADERTPGLGALEPVAFGDEEIEAARLRLTEAGRLHPGFAFSTGQDAQTVVRKLPALISATRVQGEKALAVVLARAEGAADESAKEMALLAYQRYGQGKTLAVVGQGLWRWAFLPPELAQYSHVYSEFWTQTIRWLVSESDFLPGQNIALRTDRTSYSSRETVNFLGYRRGPQPAAPPIITITQPDGTTATLVSAKGDGHAADFTASFRPRLPGEYVATVPPPPGQGRAVPASAAFTVYPGQEEDANRSADPALMRQIAQAGGGEALRLDALQNLPEKLRAAEQAAVRKEEPRTAWDRGWVLALLLGLLTSEWLLRRRAGLA